MVVQSIRIYPIKSLGGFSLQKSKLTARGLEFDRRYMLVDEDYEFLTQRQIAKMALFSVSLDGKHIVVNYNNDTSDTISFKIDQVSDWLPKRVKVWSSKVKAQGVDAKIDNWFSERLGQKCYLAYMPDASKRTINPLYGKGEIVSFADGYPFLLANEKSLQQLNSKLENPVSMDRFRANIIVDGRESFEEDHWDIFSINDQKFKVSKKCSRCPIVNIDPKLATSSPEVLKILSTFRKQNNKVTFGTNCCWLSKDRVDDVIRVGDEVVIGG